MDRIRALGEQLDGYLHSSLAMAVAQETRTRKFMVSALAVAMLGFAGLSVLLVHDIRRQLWRLNAARSRLRTLVSSLEARVARRTRELTEINQRFDAALEASGIVVFAQDRELTYTWLSHGFPDQPIEDVLGKSDQQILPARALPPIERLKRSVLDSGQPARGEVAVERDGTVRWWNLTIVPALAADGTTVGLVGGLVDISARKETEARIRLLVSEVTHRSKNLLSVIQTIMRQTAMHSASVEDFSVRFTARLRSLAASHDLLVQENWQGAALHDLVLSQLGPYADPL
jgi:PAS domain S-box-containing protein